MNAQKNVSMVHSEWSGERQHLVSRKQNTYMDKCKKRNRKKLSVMDSGIYFQTTEHTPVLTGGATT